MPTKTIPIVQDSVEISPGGTPPTWSGSNGGDGTGTATFGLGYVLVHFSADLPADRVAVTEILAFLTAATTMPSGGDLYTGFGSGLGTDNLNAEISAPYVDGADNLFNISKIGGTGGSVVISGTRVDLAWHLIVAPASGGILGAERVNIHGLDFADGDTDVTFGGTAATDILVVDEGHLTCVTPAHALGVVDVVVTTPAGTTTLTDGYEYLDYTSTPIVNAGAAQEAHGPAPSTITTDATVTPGTNNGTITYLWTQLDGPATAAIATPDAENTDLTFATYVPGTYTFQLAATSEGGVFTARDTLTVVINPTVPPRVSSGGRQVVA